MRLEYEDGKKAGRPGQRNKPIAVRPFLERAGRRVAELCLATSLAFGTVSAVTPRIAEAQDITAGEGERRVTITVTPITLSDTIANLTRRADPTPLDGGATGYGVTIPDVVLAAAILRSDGPATFAIRGPGGEWGGGIDRFISYVEQRSRQEVAGFRILFEPNVRDSDTGRRVLRVTAIPQNSAGRDIGRIDSEQVAVRGQIFLDARGGTDGGWGYVLLSEPSADRVASR